MRLATKLFLYTLLTFCLFSCKSSQDKAVEKAFNEFIEYDLSRFRGTRVTVTASPEDFQYEDYSILRNHTVADSIRKIVSVIEESYNSGVRQSKFKLAMTEESYRKSSDKERWGGYFENAKKDYEYLLSIKNDTKAKVAKFETHGDGRPYKGLYTKYLAMDPNRILAYEIEVMYKFKGGNESMTLLYNGDLTQVLKVIHRPY